MRLRTFLASAALVAVAACGGGGASSENLGIASGNSLNQAEIDAALGPANQGETVNSAVAENELTNAGGVERSQNRAGQGHRTGNSAR